MDHAGGVCFEPNKSFFSEPFDSRILVTKTNRGDYGGGWNNKSALAPSDSWASGTTKTKSGDYDGERRLADASEIHTALFDRAEEDIRVSFEAIHAEFCKLKDDTLKKLGHIRKMQREIMRERQPSRDALADFKENAKKVEKALESFSAHAANLSHIKLTLARVASLVSAEGNLAQLVVTPAASRLEPQVSMQSTYPAVTPYVPFATMPSFPLERKLDAHPKPLERMLTEYQSIETMSPPPMTVPVSSWEHEQASDSCSLYSTTFGGEKDCLSTIPKPPRTNNCTCFVFYLPASMTNDNLRALFMQCGTVLNAYVAVDKKTNRPRGFGFVDFSSASEAQAAVAKLDKLPLDGKYLSVTIKL